MEQRQKIAKDTIFNSLYIFIKISTGLILSIIVTRFLSPEDFGSFTLLMTIMSITALVINLGIPNTIIKYVSEYKGRNDNQSINSIVGSYINFELKFGLFIVSLLVLLIPLWIKIFPVNIDDIMICVVGVLPLALIRIMFSITGGLRKFGLLVLANSIIFICLLSFSYLALFSGFKVKALLTCVIFSNIIGLFSFHHFLRKEVSFSLKAKINDELKTRMTNYSKYLTSITFLDLIFFQQSEVFFLGIFRTTSEVGYYSLALNLSVAIMIIPQAFTTVLFPVFSEVSGAGQKSNLNSLYTSSVKWVTIIVLPVSLVGIFFAKPIFSIIYPISYIQSASLFQILIISSSIAAFCGVGSSGLYAAEKQETIFKLVITMAAINVILDIILIPNFGAMGASIAHFISQASAAIITMIIFCRFSRISLPIKFFIGTCGATLLMASAFFFGRYFSNLYSLIISIFVGLFLYLISLVLMQIVNVNSIVNVFKTFMSMFSTQDR